MFNFIYMTCGKHFSYLSLSLKSYRFIPDLRYLKSISIYVDCNDRLTEEQIHVLRTCSPISLDFYITLEPITDRGINVVHNELDAFVKLARKVEPNDWIVKIDSDVLITSNENAFNHARTSCASMIGNACYDFIQGGTYFLKPMEIYRLLSLPLSDNRYVMESRSGCSEDAVITEQMHRGGGVIERTNFAWHMPSLFQLRMKPHAYTFLHFAEYTKEYMEEGFRLLVESV